MANKRTVPKLADSLVAEDAPRRQNSRNLFELAYERIEGLIINCELRPGSRLSIQELQNLSGFSRTPVHQAVGRLADDTLIVVHPRHGLQIAPIDLARDRTLLRLRGDLERFVIQLATERSQSTHRNQLLHMSRLLGERRDTLTVDAFNVLDRRIDKLILSAAAEPFLEHTLRPLHTIFRRIGWIHHTQLSATDGLAAAIDCHLAILDAVANRHEDRAVRATNDLIAFVESMFEAIEREVDPSLLDASLAPLI
ncbi:MULTISPECIES: GntR family transcriptional regulator [unclassified Mesorhizobium]|uniref:GntR family transcriptional regulator n=1 Tax=unclassified Mesorhizobium TaxID=325217 RepID=UPI001126D98E|nr:MULTISPECIES: GntR family transcriptional regulator [unclassified Mesorhizobium]MBZ9894456.1 GntR family transcriptional regulator [Mesorhizobium sp. BR1-1-6]TPM57792.1 GntR family transcriptional regulator [Mesorhizobium sp. B2-2-4]TPM65847.1 GntR family transcriptional regulator [Mesorhizobium sp. B2-2-1]TPN38647.1 GntR family transcriptional regulator [Mesorhizobium sp. B1-1-6]TPN72173.1 GntR family transcriptional regulator [Mesorhizobium sp. B1-1-3]